MTTRVIATAGHVDHGKSTLVRALTGTDPDRLPEEKRRGLTIELGFARLPLVGGGDIQLIDVPGHERFIGTMLAGVGAVDACLFVVAATEGWMAQSEEHLRILQLLGLRRGVVALTMADLVEDAVAEADIAAIRSAVAGTFLEQSPIVVVDSLSHRGLPLLHDALIELAASASAEPPMLGPRVWIDRSFVMAGAGTIVTGTLTGGSLAVGDPVDVLTRRGPRRARVRSLETFGTRMASVIPGRRAAANLAGVGHRELQRGDVLVTPDRWHMTSTVDATLEVLRSAPRPVQDVGAYSLHVGTAEMTVRLRVLGARSVAPGERGLVRLRLPRRLPLVPGDRYVLRDAGSAITVGGGEVLDVEPVLRPSRARPDRDVARVVAERGWVRAEELKRLTGVAHPTTVDGWVIDPAIEAAARQALLEAVDRAGEVGLDLASLDERGRALLHGQDELEVRNGRVLRQGAGDAIADHPYLTFLDERPFQPPSPQEAGAPLAEVRELVRRGLAVQEGTLYFSPRAVCLAAEAAAALLALEPAGFTVADLRSRLRTTRRYALAILALLDREGVTRRRGDVRIGGPRLPGVHPRPD